MTNECTNCVKKIKPSGFQEELPMQGKGGQKVDMPPWSCICARNSYISHPLFPSTDSNSVYVALMM